MSRARQAVIVERVEAWIQFKLSRWNWRSNRNRLMQRIDCAATLRCCEMKHEHTDEGCVRIGLKNRPEQATFGRMKVDSLSNSRLELFFSIQLNSARLAAPLAPFVTFRLIAHSHVGPVFHHLYTHARSAHLNLRTPATNATAKSEAQSQQFDCVSTRLTRNSHSSRK